MAMWHQRKNNSTKLHNPREVKGDEAIPHKTLHGTINQCKASPRGSQVYFKMDQKKKWKERQQFSFHNVNFIIANFVIAKTQEILFGLPWLLIPAFFGPKIPFCSPLIQYQVVFNTSLQPLVCGFNYCILSPWRILGDPSVWKNNQQPMVKRRTSCNFGRQLSSVLCFWHWTHVCPHWQERRL